MEAKSKSRRKQHAKQFKPKAVRLLETEASARSSTSQPAYASRKALLHSRKKKFYYLCTHPSSRLHNSIGELSRQSRQVCPNA